MDLTDKAIRMNRVGMNHEHKHKWSPEKRIEVVTKTLALGNMRLVSELTGVSYQLIREWKQAPWWQEIVDEIRSSRNALTETKLSKLVDKSLETVADRLEHGNLFLSKQGTLERKPLTVLEANKIATDMLTQETLVQKREALQTQGQEAASMADIIRDLAKQFANFNTKRTVENVTDASNRSSEKMAGSQQEEVSSLFQEMAGQESGVSETDHFEDEVSGVFEDTLPEESQGESEIHQFSPQRSR